MLKLFRTFGRWLLLGDFKPEAVAKQVTGIGQDIAALQQQVASHSPRLRALENDVLTAKNVSERLAALERLEGRLQACENSASAANSRCERNETRLGRLEHFNPGQRVVELPLPPKDEDAPQVRNRTCGTCRGSGHLGPSGDPCFNLIVCSSCDGSGYQEVPA